MKKYSEKLNCHICNGCEYESLLYCKKYQKECVSFNEHNSFCQIPCFECLENDGYQDKQQSYTLSQMEKIKPVAKFHIPSLEMLPFVAFLLEKKNKYPEVFYENREISEIYDAFPGAIWNGRTSLVGKPFLGLQDINDIKNRVEKLGISFNLTWNNHLIDEQDIQDKYCNFITEIFHSGNHSITVSSPLLFKYLKEKYPNFCYYQSVIQTTCLEDFAKKDSGYDIYLASQRINNNWDKLNAIPEEDRGNIEFLCDEFCFPLCSKIQHYEIANYCIKNYAREARIEEHACPVDWQFAYYNKNRWPITIKPEHIDRYLENGFTHFKLVGRGGTKNIALFYKICKYLIKPEYFEDIFFQGCSIKGDG